MIRRVTTLAVLFGLLTAAAAVAAEEERGAGDPVVAVVNGASIYRSDVDAAHAELPPQYRSAPLEAIYEPLLDILVNTKLAAAEARRRGFHEEESVKHRLARIEDRTLERALLARHIEEASSEAALRERYAKLVEETRSRVEVRARHILVATEAQALEIIVDLKAGGDFATLAEERSIGPSKSKGGDLGYFGKADMVPAFADAAFALTAGDITDTPVQTQFGWHVIRVEDRRSSQPPTFEEAEEELRASLANEVATALIQGLREKGKVQKFNPDGSVPPGGERRQ